MIALSQLSQLKFHKFKVHPSLPSFEQYLILFNAREGFAMEIKKRKHLSYDDFVNFLKEVSMNGCVVSLLIVL